MFAKRKSDGKIIEVREWRGASDVVYSTLDMNEFYQDADLDLLPEKETAVIEGFVARDEEGYISLFPDKPERDMYDCNDVTYGFWDETNGHHIELPTDSFPSVTWQSEPKKVKITIEEI